MVRSIGAVVGGFLVMAIVTMITTAAAVALFLGRPQPGTPTRPTPLYLAVNLLCGLAAAIIGGFVCGRLSAAQPLAHAAALATLVLVMSVASAMTGQSGAPGQAAWYPYAIGAIGAIGVLLGGGIRVWSDG